MLKLFRIVIILLSFGIYFFVIWHPKVNDIILTYITSNILNTIILAILSFFLYLHKISCIRFGCIEKSGLNKKTQNDLFNVKGIKKFFLFDIYKISKRNHFKILLQLIINLGYIISLIVFVMSCILFNPIVFLAKVTISLLIFQTIFGYLVIDNGI